MAVFADLSGFKGEDLMADVFRPLGYERVRQAERTAGKGRDILMEKIVDGTCRAVVAECKHTGAAGRPVVQKLHSRLPPSTSIATSVAWLSHPGRPGSTQRPSSRPTWWLHSANPQ